MKKFMSITRFFFTAGPIAAIIWVTWSYGLATYATVVLEQPFPAEGLAQKAIETLLGVGGLKVVENIFEHNNGGIFGNSREGGEEDGTGETVPGNEEEGVG